MKTIFASFVCFAVIAAVNSKGLRGIISYAYDDTFEGAKLYGQELSLKAFEKLLSTKDFGPEPKLLSSSYSILGLLDGKCDVKLECCKNCDKTCSVASTPKVPSFLTTPPVIEHSTKKTPATKKVTSLRNSTPKAQIVEKTTPQVEVATPKSTILPRKPVDSRRNKPRPSPKVPGLPKVTPKVPEVTPTPSVNIPKVTPPSVKVPEVISSTAKTSEATPSLVIVTNSTPSPSKAFEVTPPAHVSKVTPPARVPEVTPPARVPEVTSPVRVPEVTPPARVSKVTPPARISEVTPPARVPEVTLPAQVSKVTPPARVPEVTRPTPKVTEVTPPAVSKGTPPPRVNRMINQPSKKPFRGPPYLPQPEVTTERVDHTWKTYAHRDVTFRHNTYVPFVATGTWNPNTVTYEPVTAAPKYVAPSNQLDSVF